MRTDENVACAQCAAREWSNLKNQPHFITLAEEVVARLDTVATLIDIPANLIPEEFPAIEDVLS